MKSPTLYTLAKVLLLSTAFATLQACAPAPASYDTVDAAFNSSGVVAVKPYTRSIFSTHNF